MLPYNHTSIVRRLSEYLIRRHNDGYVWIQGPFGVGKSYIVRQSIKNTYSNLNNDLILQFNSTKLVDFITSFINEIVNFTQKSHKNDILDRISKSYPEIPINLLSRLKGLDTLTLLKSIFNHENPIQSLKYLFIISNQLLYDNNIKLPIGIKLIPDLDINLFECLVKYLPNSNIIPIIICNDMSSILYFYKNLISEDSFILDVQEPEEDFIRDYIRTNTSNFIEVIDAILLIAGRNLSLINRISDHIRSSNHSISQDYSDEFYPFDKNKQDRQMYELLESQKACIMTLAETIFKVDIEEFNNKISKFLSFPPIERMRSEMRDIHFKVTVYESIRYIMSKKIMQSYNNDYQKNPIIMALLYSDVLFYHISFGKFTINSLTKRLMIDFINSDYQNLTSSEMAEYNLNYLLNYRIIQREIDSLM